MNDETKRMLERPIAARIACDFAIAHEGKVLDEREYVEGSARAVRVQSAKMQMAWHDKKLSQEDRELVRDYFLEIAQAWMAGPE